MKKKPFLVLGVAFLLLTACSSEPQEGLTMEPLNNEHTTSTTATPPTSNQNESETPNNQNEETSVKEQTHEEKQDQLRENQKRSGELNLEHIENIGVPTDLEKAVLGILEATKDNDDDKRDDLIYDPNFDIFEDMAPYILEVTKIEMDNSRVQDVTEEYSLSDIASDIAIVKITWKTLDVNQKEVLSIGDYIFIKVDDTWKFYRFQ